MNLVLKQKKVGFIGAGNMAQAIIAGLLDSQTLEKNQIFVSSRTDKRLKRVEEKYGVQIRNSNEEIVDECSVIIVATKPQDFFTAVEPIATSFSTEHTVISLAAGIQLGSLKKTLFENENLVRVMPNVPVKVKEGMVGYIMAKESIISSRIVEALFSPLGKVIELEDEEAMSAFTVGSSSGVGFVLELMQYWQDWLEGYGLSKEEAREITVQTFIGAGKLAEENPQLSFYEYIDLIASKKGVTSVGLESMREMDLDRALRIAFEKAYIRDRELGK